MKKIEISTLFWKIINQWNIWEVKFMTHFLQKLTVHFAINIYFEMLPAKISAQAPDVCL